MNNLEEISADEYFTGVINSIAGKYPKLRQASKPATFALTYQGTWHTLKTNCGFSAKEAKIIEANYHKMYKTSINWVEQKLIQASDDGYVTCAFGLRVRTPLISQTIRGGKHTPYAAVAEGRTAGNALGQSYCLLTNRAANEFMQRVWDSEYRYDIKPCGMIHDSIYLLIKNDITVAQWVNDNLIDCMQWQEDPLLQHPNIKFGAELEIHYNSWDQPVTIPNHASADHIRALCLHAKEQYDAL